MVDINFIRENPDIVKKAAKDKLMKVDIDRLLELDKLIKVEKSKIDELRMERNNLSKEIPTLQGDDRQVKVNRVKEIKEQLSKLEPELEPLEKEYNDIMLTVPSVPEPEVPIGVTDEDNVEVERWGTVREFDFEPKDHVELMESLDLVDIPRGVRIGGSRSYYLKNEGALLESAITRYMIDKLVKKGFTYMSVPVMVKDSAMYGTGYFPLGYDQSYKITEDELYLVGTAEVALASYHIGETLNENELPKLYTGYSTCFRREAGTYGKDTRGLYRVHQFQKVEQVIICKNDKEEARKWHEFILNNALEMLQELNLPYRVVLACTGDIGIGQVRKHDVETWMPSRGKYSETHSCSTLNDFQARRLNLKYKTNDGETKYAYTLNNTAVASPRILIPLIETYQNADGSVTIPEVLRPYMNGQEKIMPKK